MSRNLKINKKIMVRIETKAELIKKRTKSKVFTLSEAQQIQREFDNVALTGESMNWHEVKTGNSVNFSY